jgi:hypothetical protein
VYFSSSSRIDFRDDWDTPQIPTFLKSIILPETLSIKSSPIDHVLTSVRGIAILIANTEKQNNIYARYANSLNVDAHILPIRTDEHQDLLSTFGIRSTDLLAVYYVNMSDRKCTRRPGAFSYTGLEEWINGDAEGQIPLDNLCEPRGAFLNLPTLYIVIGVLSFAAVLALIVFVRRKYEKQLRTDK